MNGEEYLERFSKVKTYGEKQRLLAEAQAAENVDRELFARKRDQWHVPELDDPYKGLVPVFDQKGNALFTERKWFEEEEEIPRLFDLGKEERNKRRAGRVTVDSLDKFKEQFIERFGNFLLADMNWDNVVAAGGAVQACLLPLKNAERSRKYFYADKYESSDIDLFLFGLSVEEANRKLVELYETLCAACPMEVICFRSAHAVTMVSEYPYRHVQVVLRIYSSPYEILAGFDVDSCTFLYDGKNVYTTPRGHHALVSGYNTVDVSRRSLSFEMRLAKYARRGFEVLVPDYKRELVNLDIFKKPWSELKGLEKLLLLEVLGNPFLTLYYSKLRNRAVRISDSERYEKTAGTAEESRYATLYIPWGPGDNAQKTLKAMTNTDIAINSEWICGNRSYRLHPCFFGTAEEILQDCSPDDPPIPQDVGEEELRGYVRGPLTWLEDNPGCQQVGSFHPITDQDWRAGALFVTLEDKVHDMVARDDVEALQFFIESEMESWDPNAVDSTSGDSLLHIGLKCGSNRCCTFLLEADLVNPASKNKSTTALHLVAKYNRIHMLPVLRAALDRHFLSAEEREKGRKAKDRGYVYKEFYRGINSHALCDLRRKFDHRLNGSGKSTTFASMAEFVEEKAGAFTALQVAVALGRIEITKSLLEQFGASVGFVEERKWGSTRQTLPVVFLAVPYDSALVQLLVQHSLAEVDSSASTTNRRWNKPHWLDVTVKRCCKQRNPALQDLLKTVLRTLDSHGKRGLILQTLNGSDALKSAVQNYNLESALTCWEFLSTQHKATLQIEFHFILWEAFNGFIKAWEEFLQIQAIATHHHSNLEGRLSQAMELVDASADVFLWALRTDVENGFGALTESLERKGPRTQSAPSLLRAIQAKYETYCTKFARLQLDLDVLQSCTWIGGTLEAQATDALLETYGSAPSYESAVLSELARSPAERESDNANAEKKRRAFITELNNEQEICLRVITRILAAQKVATRFQGTASSPRFSLGQFVPRALRRKGNTSSDSSVDDKGEGNDDPENLGLYASQQLLQPSPDEILAISQPGLTPQSRPEIDRNLPKDTAKEEVNLKERLFGRFSNLRSRKHFTWQDSDGLVLRAFQAAFAGDLATLLQMIMEEDLPPPESLLHMCDSLHQTIVGLCLSRSNDPHANMEAILSVLYARYVPPAKLKETLRKKGTVPQRIDNLLLMQSGLVDSDSESDVSEHYHSDEDSDLTSESNNGSDTDESSWLDGVDVNALAYTADLDRHKAGERHLEEDLERKNQLRGGKKALLVHPSIFFQRQLLMSQCQLHDAEAVMNHLRLADTILKRLGIEEETCIAQTLQGKLSLEMYAILRDDVKLLELAAQTRTSTSYSPPKGLDMFCVVLDRVDCLKLIVAHFGGGSWWKKYLDDTHESIQPTWIQIALACGSVGVVQLLCREDGCVQLQHLFQAYLANGNGEDEQSKKLALTAASLLRQVKTTPEQFPSLRDVLGNANTEDKETIARLLLYLRAGVEPGLCPPSFSTLTHARSRSYKESLLNFVAFGHAEHRVLAYLCESGLVSTEELNLPCLVFGKQVSRTQQAFASFHNFAKCSDSLNPVHVAAAFGEAEMLISFMDAGADPLVVVSNKLHDWNVLHAISRRLHDSSVLVQVEQVVNIIEIMWASLGEEGFLRLAVDKHPCFSDECPLLWLHAYLPEDAFGSLFAQVDVATLLEELYQEERLVREDQERAVTPFDVVEYFKKSSLGSRRNQQELGHMIDATCEDDPDWCLRDQDQNGKTLVDIFVDKLLSMVLSLELTDEALIETHPLMPFLRRVEEECIPRKSKSQNM